MSATAKATPVMTLPEIGQAFGGGFFSGITRDPDTGKHYLNITAGAAHELEGALGEDGVKIEGADSYTNSRGNTEAMAAAGSELAQKVLAMDIGGFTDWAIPARDVQELQYRHFKPTIEENWANSRSGNNPNSEPVGLLYSDESPAQTPLIAFQEGGDDAFRDLWYWSSSQCFAHDAFGVAFGDGYQGTYGKDYEFRVRPVRSQLIDYAPKMMVADANSKILSQ
ncbi:DUF1566 domain-containing protein [Pseudomonas fluorescens]|uniref:DUF1566 domain-containing protein n=1 Tax=Pseudomonas fluorescens TaxID=294 RepID=A0A5E7PTN7_PSEFL|nr:DUF1566 domain-containing protein [Pseudomonas fluorescens]VVP51977.1 hypothetical protein PS880_05418 [Pseudomonas fluorescens]